MTSCMISFFFSMSTTRFLIMTASRPIWLPHLTEAYGVDPPKLYWKIFEQLRSELGYADYLGALERFRLEKMHDPRVLRMSSWLVDYPFADGFMGGRSRPCGTCNNGAPR